MSYKSIAAMTADGYLRARLTACAAEQAKAAPQQWVEARIWQIAVAPGWGAAWDSAVAAAKTNIGNDESVITDAMILSEIQPMT